MLGGAREFLHGLILLRNRHLPLLSYALIELGPVSHRPHYHWPIGIVPVLTSGPVRSAKVSGA